MTSETKIHLVFKPDEAVAQCQLGPGEGRGWSWLGRANTTEFSKYARGGGGGYDQEYFSYTVKRIFLRDFRALHWTIFLVAFIHEVCLQMTIWANPSSLFCPFANRQLPFVSLSTQIDKRQISLHEEQSVSGLDWTSVFRFPFIFFVKLQNSQQNIDTYRWALNSLKHWLIY